MTEFTEIAIISMAFGIMLGYLIEMLRTSIITIETIDGNVN